jgi:hypothetical protein
MLNLKKIKENYKLDKTKKITKTKEKKIQQ